MRGDTLAAMADELGVARNGGLTHVDRTSPTAPRSTIWSRAVGKAWGAPDIVINNAGVYPSGFLIDIDAAEWDRIFDINLRAPFLVARGFAKLMIAGKVQGQHRQHLVRRGARACAARSCPTAPPRPRSTG